MEVDDGSAEKACLRQWTIFVVALGLWPANRAYLDDRRLTSTGEAAISVGLARNMVLGQDLEFLERHKGLLSIIVPVNQASH